MKQNQEINEAATKPGDQDDEQPQDLFTFLQSSPLAEAIAAGELDPEWFERSRDSDREIDFGSVDSDA
ncbi:MAG TPA: hypothetical protein VF746_12220 [Longimicrobium sp.]|jgi:hypothetical protein